MPYWPLARAAPAGCRPSTPTSTASLTPALQRTDRRYFPGRRAEHVQVLLTPGKPRRPTTRYSKQVVERREDERKERFEEERQKKVFRIDNVRGTDTSSPLSILLTARPHCDYIKVKHLPSINSQAAALPSVYVTRRFDRQAWSALHPLDKQHEFLQALRTLAGLPHTAFEAQPAVKRLLKNETDVAEVFSANEMNPLVQLLNSFLAPAIRGRYTIEVFSQVHRSSPDEGSSYVDYAFMVVDKPQGAKSYDQDGTRRLKPMHPLVLIELKRYNLATFDNWEGLAPCDEPLEKDSRAFKLLPQLLMYSNRWQCRRIYLSDWNDVIAFDINPLEVENTRRTITLSFSDCRGKNKKDCRSLYDFGPKMSLCFDAFETLRELGMLDDALGVQSVRSFKPESLRPYEDLELSESEGEEAPPKRVSKAKQRKEARLAKQSKQEPKHTAVKRVTRRKR